MKTRLFSIASIVVALASLALFTASAVHAEDEVDLGIITVKTRKEADSIRDKLNGGASFEELARQYSEGPAVSRGGRVGRQGLKGLRSEYRAALQGLAPQKPSKAVPIEDGYAVLMRFNSPRVEPTRQASLALQPKTYYQPKIAPEQAPARAVSPDELKDAPSYLRARRAFMGGLEAMVVGDLDGAEKGFSEALGFNPHEESATFMLDVVRGAKSGSYDKQAAIQFGDGFLALTEGDVKRAGELFGKAAKSDGNLWQAKLFQANMMAGLGQEQQAYGLLVELAAQKPDVPQVHLSLAMISMNQGKFDQGKRELERTLALSPTMAQALYQMGQVAVHDGDAQKAVLYFKSAVAADPNYEEAYNDLGLIYAHLGQSKEAEASFQKALELNPAFFPAHIGLGNLYGKAGQFNLAVDEFNKALAIDPTFAPAHFNAALAYISLDMWPEAINHADRAVALGFQLPPEMVKDLAAHRR